MNTIRPIDIIKTFQLEHYLEIVLAESSSNYAPYHNINHVLCMVKYAYIIGSSENLDNDEIKMLIVSALFHDFNHTQGKEDDFANIKIAIESVKKYVEEEIIDVVIDVIKATQYPYIIDTKDLTKYQRIIRDCDFMQTFEPNYVHQILFGISTEIGMSVKEFLPIQLKFLDSIKFNTEKGREIGEDKIPIIKEEIVFLQQII